MAFYFVTRHPGACEWARRLGLEVDVWLPHLDPVLVRPGDVVAGILPVNLAAIVCEQGGRYLNLSLNLPRLRSWNGSGPGWRSLRCSSRRLPD